MTHNFLTIREMSDLFKVSHRTLRFYETKELLFPVREGSQRLYTRSCRVRTKFILQGKRFGFQLEEIRRLLNLYDKRDRQNTQIKETYRIANIHLEELRRRHLELGETIVEFECQIGKAAERIRKAGQNTPQLECQVAG